MGASIGSLESGGFGRGSAGAGNAQALATDGRQLDTLRRQAGRDPRGAVQAVAQQFEALFTQQLLKSMRAANLGGDPLDNAGSQLGTQMLDAQLSTQLAGRPGGLGQAIARQLERQMGLAAGAAGTPGSGATGAAGNATGGSSVSTTALAGSLASAAAARVNAGTNAGTNAGGNPTGAAQPAAAANAPARGDAGTRQPLQVAADFVRQHRDAAQAAQQATGIPADFILAQAAHETGWGRREITGADGRASNNLFGIKAGGDWRGPTVDVTTTEFIDGAARKVVQKFRAYASQAESFVDYAKLMAGSPRYAQVLTGAAQGGAQAFAQGLQKAGYATDPEYAAKLGRVINTTLRLQRSQA